MEVERGVEAERIVGLRGTCVLESNQTSVSQFLLSIVG